MVQRYNRGFKTTVRILYFDWILNPRLASTLDEILLPNLAIDTLPEQNVGPCP